MSLRAVGYCRVSTEEQALSGFSLGAQRVAIESFIQSKGWQAGPIYTDAGISGRSDQRPALRRLLQDAAQGHFDVVVVHAIDRFYRSLSGLLAAIDAMRQDEVSLVSISENLDFTTPWGKLTLAVLGTLAEIYIDKLSLETQKGKLARAKQGIYNGSIPFGYCNGLCARCTDANGPGYCPLVGSPDRTGERSLVPHPIEAVGVRRAFRLSSSGLYSDRDIADYLNLASIRYRGRNYPLRPKRRPGDIERFGPPIFGRATVREMLLRVLYTGVVPYFGLNENKQKRKRRNALALYPGRHRALVPQALYDEAYLQRSQRKTTPTKAMQTGRALVYPLTGLLHCGGCGEGMRGTSNEQRKRYYQCSGRIKRSVACKQRAVQANDIEEQLAAELLNLKLADNWRFQVKQNLLQAEDKEAAFKKLTTRLERAKELYIDGDLTRSEYDRQRALYKEQMFDLTDLDISDIIATGYLIKNFKLIWETKSSSLKRKLLRSIIAAVTIRGNALTGWTPNSAFFPLLRHGSPFSWRPCHNGSDGGSYF